MGKQTVLYPHSGILLTNQGNKLVTHATTQGNLRYIMLRVRSQSPKARCCMIVLYCAKGKSTGQRTDLWASGAGCQEGLTIKDDKEMGGVGVEGR